MDYGITLRRDELADHPTPLSYLTNFARAAEQMGFAYAVVGDRLEAGLDCLTMLSVIAEAAGRLKLVTSVIVLPPRGIMLTAKQFASLDLLSGGRVIAGVGTGSMFRDYEIVGMDPSDMRARFEEGVRAMRAYLTPDAPPFKGRFYDTTGVHLEPRRPTLPIWIGSWGSDVGLRRVARLADGWLSSAARATRARSSSPKTSPASTPSWSRRGRIPPPSPAPSRPWVSSSPRTAPSWNASAAPATSPAPPASGSPSQPTAPRTTPTPTTWSAPAPPAWTRSTAGRRPASERSSWSLAAQTRWDRPASSWMR